MWRNSNVPCLKWVAEGIHMTTDVDLWPASFVYISFNHEAVRLHVSNKDRSKTGFVPVPKPALPTLNQPLQTSFVPAPKPALCRP